MTEWNVLGTAEVARLCHTSSVTVSRWRSAGRLPEPDKQLAAGPVWRGQRILRWAHKAGRLQCCLCSKPIDPTDKWALVIPGRAVSVAHYWCNVDHQHDLAQDHLAQLGDEIRQGV
jgi:hypothetical protein